MRVDLEHRRAPIRLDTLRVAAPCNVPWDAMKGDDRARDCAKCEKTVYNVSAMSRDEAEDFLAARGAAACVRFFRRSDGTILTADCPVGVRRRRRKLALAAGALAGVAAGAGVAALVASDPIMGKIVAPAPDEPPDVEPPADDPSETELWLGEVAAPDPELREIIGR